MMQKYGADTVKFQTFSPLMTLKSSNNDFKVKEFGKEIHSGIFIIWLNTFKWHKELFYYCKKKILCFSTPFDETAVIF